MSEVRVSPSRFEVWHGFLGLVKWVEWEVCRHGASSPTGAPQFGFGSQCLAAIRDEFDDNFFSVDGVSEDALFSGRFAWLELSTDFSVSGQGASLATQTWREREEGEERDPCVVNHPSDCRH